MKYRCTISGIYDAPTCYGHLDTGSRNGHYFDVSTPEEALLRMIQEYPESLDMGYTIEEFSDGRKAMILDHYPEPWEWFFNLSPRTAERLFALLHKHNPCLLHRTILSLKRFFKSLPKRPLASNKKPPACPVCGGVMVRSTEEHFLCCDNNCEASEGVLVEMGCPCHGTYRTLADDDWEPPDTEGF